MYAARVAISLDVAAGQAAIGLRWLATRRGLGATNHFETGGHIRSRAGLVYPDIQFHFLPLAISYDGKSLANGHGFQVHVGTKRSKSRGWVRLRDGDTHSLPRVQFNYMTHDDDWQEMRACIRLSREIFAQGPMAAYVGDELAPGPAANPMRRWTTLSAARSKAPIILAAPAGWEPILWPWLTPIAG